MAILQPLDAPEPLKPRKFKFGLEVCQLVRIAADTRFQASAHSNRDSAAAIEEHTYAASERAREPSPETSQANQNRASTEEIIALIPVESRHR